MSAAPGSAALRSPDMPFLPRSICPQPPLSRSPRPRLPRPFTPLPCREHQLIVAVAHNGTAVEGACSGEPQPFNASRQPGTYVAAVLNLTGPTDFVLGDGTHGQGYHNTALRPGWHYVALLRLVRHSQQVLILWGFFSLGTLPARAGTLGGSGPATHGKQQCHMGSAPGPCGGSPGAVTGQCPRGPWPQVGIWWPWAGGL